MKMESDNLEDEKRVINTVINASTYKDKFFMTSEYSTIFRSIAYDLVILRCLQILGYVQEHFLESSGLLTKSLRVNSNPKI